MHIFSMHAQFYHRHGRRARTAHLHMCMHTDANICGMQDVARVDHKQSVEDFVRQGKDTECQVLAKAVQLHRISSRISMFAFVRNDGAAEADSFALVRCWRGQSDGIANTKF